MVTPAVVLINCKVCVVTSSFGFLSKVGLCLCTQLINFNFYLVINMLKWFLLSEQHMILHRFCTVFVLCVGAGIQKLVLEGRVGEAIDATHQLYPGLLECNPNLLFMLKWVFALHTHNNKHAHCLWRTFIWGSFMS